MPENHMTIIYTGHVRGCVSTSRGIFAGTDNGEFKEENTVTHEKHRNTHTHTHTPATSLNLVDIHVMFWFVRQLTFMLTTGAPLLTIISIIPDTMTSSIGEP